jgi:hypothetical protein
MRDLQATWARTHDNVAVVFRHQRRGVTTGGSSPAAILINTAGAGGAGVGGTHVQNCRNSHCK